MAGFPLQIFPRNSLIVLTLVAAAAVIPHLFPFSSVSAARELLVNFADDQVTCSLCEHCHDPCPPSLPPPPSPPVIESPPPSQQPLPPPVSSPPPALPPLLPPPLTVHCPPPPVPPICGACYSPPTGDIGLGTPPSPPSGGIVYGSPPPPTMYPGYGGGGGDYPPRPNIVTPYFSYDGPPPRTASTGRSTPLFVYFWVAALLPLHFIM